MKKGQVSVEYLLITGFLFVLLIPLLVLFVHTQKDTQDGLVQAQARRVADLIRDGSERVYYAGDPAQETLQLYFPERIKAVTIANHSITFTMAAGSGSSDVFVPSSAPLNGTLRTNRGVHQVRVRRAGDTVQISET
jgi:uncharacterized protein (UPF0333 family)